MESLLVGSSPQIKQLRSELKQVAMSGPRLNVVLVGATGTGKELCAKAIHVYGPWRSKKFQALNCSGLNEQLIEAQLFGHVKGAFTGAVQESNGVLGEIDTDFFRKPEEKEFAGFLFLDEIHDLPASTQGLLLRLLESGEYRRVGDKKIRYANIRIIAALQPGAKKRNRLRNDLYNRLAEVVLQLPSLYERRTDIPELAKHFLQTMVLSNFQGYWDGTSREIDMGRVQDLLNNTKFIPHLQQHDWKLGNVRELRSVLKRALLLNDLSLPKQQETQNADKGTSTEVPAEDSLRLVLPQNFDHLPSAKAFMSAYVKKAYGKLKEAGVSDAEVRRKLEIADARTLDKYLERAVATKKTGLKR